MYYVGLSLFHRQERAWDDVRVAGDLADGWSEVGQRQQCSDGYAKRGKVKKRTFTRLGHEKQIILVFLTNVNSQHAE